MPSHRVLHLLTVSLPAITFYDKMVVLWFPSYSRFLRKNLNRPEHTQSKAATTGQQTAASVVTKRRKTASILMVCKFQQSNSFHYKKWCFIRSDELKAPNTTPPQFLEFKKVLRYHEHRKSLSLNISDLGPIWFTCQFVVGLHVHKSAG